MRTRSTLLLLLAWVIACTEDRPQTQPIAAAAGHAGSTPGHGPEHVSMMPGGAGGWMSSKPVVDAAAPMPTDSGTLDAATTDAAASLDANLDAAVDAGLPDDSDGGTEQIDSGTDGGTVDAGVDSGSAGSAGSIAGSGGTAGSASLPPTCTGPDGLYGDAYCQQLADGVREYDPQFHLWSDGAVKTRWVYLPAGSTINGSNPDRWVFPVGTRFYKEFRSPDGSLRVETRRFEKMSAGTSRSSWTYTTCLWSADQTSCQQQPNGNFAGRSNYLGSGLNVPSSTDCVDCHNHGNVNRDMVNGFGALQLNWFGAGVTLASLIADGTLTNAATSITTDATTKGRNSAEVAALGYFHANCGHCHAEDSGPRGQRLFVMAGVPLAQQPIWQTAVCKPFSSTVPGAVSRIDPGSSVTSAIYLRDSHRGDSLQMPPLGTAKVDTEGLSIEAAWINSLSGCSAN